MSTECAVYGKPSLILNLIFWQKYFGRRHNQLVPNSVKDGSL